MLDLPTLWSIIAINQIRTDVIIYQYNIQAPKKQTIQIMYEKG
jgi:hypothetical protein